MLEDLKRSGITKADAAKLKMTTLTAATTYNISNKRVKSYRIPYFDIQGRKTDFFRLRFLEDVKPSFAGADTKSQRYWQAPDSHPRAYFPPVVPWDEIAESDETIYITEGEKKAAKACLMDIPTIGLGGVWSWRSKKDRIALIQDLEQFTWEDREVGFVFDNDLYTNEKVLQALRALAKELTRRGAKVFVVLLPQSDKKIGLDDYLLNHDTLDDLDIEEYEDSYELWKLNEELAFIQNPSSYYHIATHQLFKEPKKLSDGLLATRMVMQWEGDRPKRVNIINVWKQWPCRRTHGKLVYEPDTVVTGDYNMWKGWGVQPKRGNVKPFTELVDYLFKGCKKAERTWFMQWLAYPIQNPGTKMTTAVLLHSNKQGIGKSFLGHIMGDIYGDNFNVIGQDEIHDQYNDWLVGKQFILGEEIIGTNKRQDADRIKNMITREQVGVNKKFTPRFNIRDCVNYIFTSNHPDALFLGKEDRRFFVHEIRDERLPDKFYTRLNEWRYNGGPAALMYHLQHNVDCSTFNPAAPAPYTEAKDNMTDLSLSDLDDFCHTLAKDPDTLLRYGDTTITRDLYTVSELINIYDPEERTRVTHIAMSKALRRAGFVRKAIGTDKGTRKLWPVRNAAAWLTRGAADWAAHYNGSLALLQGQKTRKY